MIPILQKTHDMIFDFFLKYFRESVDFDLGQNSVVTATA